MGLKSLFIVSLPRSFSSITYQVARNVLQLQEPVWTTDGELLNLDRFFLNAHAKRSESLKFISQWRHPELFERGCHFLRQATEAEGFAYKDVVQPFIAAAVAASGRLTVLRIRRNLAEVAHSMWANGWLYPECAARLPGELLDRALEGLILGEAALDTIAAAGLVEYEDLVTDESKLHEALCRLYPGTEIPRFSYIDDRFKEGRERIRARHSQPAFREIEDRLEAVRARLA